VRTVEEYTTRHPSLLLVFLKDFFKWHGIGMDTHQPWAG